MVILSCVVCYRNTFKTLFALYCMKDSSNKFYDKKFYSNNYPHSYYSAKEVVPIIIKTLSPNSVVDLGCGSGTWIKVFQEEGVKKTLGIDFHNAKTLIPKKYFLKHDLRKTLKLNEKFDLAISFEVAEHVETKYSETFVDNLVNLSDIILFGAATPKQEGENHINEHWHIFWISLFEKRGYVAIDLIRPYILLNERVSMDYRQNPILFVRKNILERDALKFIPYFDKSKQLLFRKSYAKQLSFKHRVAYRINNQIFGGLFNSIIDMLFLKKFFGDITSIDVKGLKK